ncbi:MAG: glycosyltransferase family A protein, partial [Rhodospirillaceae bacterium]
MTAVTIGLPVYNGAEFLEDALASLCAQTFDDLRIVISDNASTDATPDIIATWAARDSRISAHRQPENIGMVPNFAWVLGQADSPWFMLAAHDDTWSPTFVEALYRAATARPGCLLAVPQVIKTHPDGREDTRTPVPETLDQVDGLVRRRLLLRSAQSGWVYGLFDRRARLAAQEPTRRFGHTWSNEFITMLPMLLSGAVTGSNEAIYYQRQTGLSADRYKPKTLA